MKKHLWTLAALLPLLLSCGSSHPDSCKVTFDLNYEGSTAIVKTLAYESGYEGALLREATVDTQYRTALLADVWTKDAASTDVYTFPQIIKADLTLYAKWEDGHTAIWPGKADRDLYIKGYSIPACHLNQSISGTSSLIGVKDLSVTIEFHTDDAEPLKYYEGQLTAANWSKDATSGLYQNGDDTLSYEGADDGGDLTMTFTVLK